MLDIDKINTEMDSFFNNPQKVAEMVNYIKKKRMIETHQLKRLSKFIKTIPKNELDNYFSKFLEWEEETEQFYYKERHCHKSSMIFNTIINYIERYGKTPSLIINEDFLSEIIIYKKYYFKLYCGQGCFWRILKNDKIIFQNL